MEKYDDLKEIISTLKITCLINNAGICHEFPEMFLDHSQKEKEDLVQINIQGMLDTTTIILPKLLENKEGVMINLGSYVGFLTPPLLSTYAGTKAFINSWSTSLNGELKSKGIQVICLTPMYVQSNISGFKKASLQVPSPIKFAESALRFIGNPLIGPICSGYWVHDTVSYLTSLVPFKIRQNIELKTLTGVSIALKKKKK